MVDNCNCKKNFVKIFSQIPSICKETMEEVDKNFEKGRKDAFDDVLQWYNNISENGQKLVSVNQIIMYVQEKLDNKKNKLNKKDDKIDNEDSSKMGRLFSFPSYN